MTAERTFVPLQTASAQQGTPAPQHSQQQPPQQAYENQGSYGKQSGQQNFGQAFGAKKSLRGVPQQQQYQQPVVHQPPVQEYYDDQSLTNQYDPQATTYDDLPPAPEVYDQDTYMPDDELPPPPPQVDDWQGDEYQSFAGTPGGGPQCRVIFEYEAQREDELDLHPGEILTILREDEGWWEVEFNGRIGMIPSNFGKFFFFVWLCFF